jgi:hypothetical protein
LQELVIPAGQYNLALLLAAAPRVALRLGMKAQQERPQRQLALFMVGRHHGQVSLGPVEIAFSAGPLAAVLMG